MRRWRRRLQSQDGDAVETHEINVTPFIDVMLVLLIIFMVAAPLSTVDTPIWRAFRSRRPSLSLARTRLLFLTIKSDMSLMLGNDQISAGTLAPTLDRATASARNKRLFLRADKSVPYGELMRVMNLLRAAGYLKVALVGLEGAPSTAPAAPHGSP